MVRRLALASLLLGSSSCSQPEVAAPHGASASALSLNLTCPPDGPRVHRVGPGEEFPDLAGVPWRTLAAGDTVCIFPNTGNVPYHQKFGITKDGTALAPITIRGIPDESGNRPILDGTNSTCVYVHPSQNRGIIGISSGDHVVIENLEIRNATGPFTGCGGVPLTFSSAAAAIYIPKGSSITLRNNLLHDCGHGIQTSSGTKDLVIEGNRIWNNGRLASQSGHNTYTEGQNILYQYNWFGPPCAGCAGNNLKDRSGNGCVIRYNWIEGGLRTLDLVDGKYTSPADVTDVYGNVLIKLPNPTSNSRVIHFGGDQSSLLNRGTLRFFHNTVVTKRNATTLFQLDSGVIEATNNIFYSTVTGSGITLSAGPGSLNMDFNWLEPGYALGNSVTTGLPGTNRITAGDPGFVSVSSTDDCSTNDFHLTATVDAVNQGGPSPQDYPLVEDQYWKHQSSEPRFELDSAPDIGAYEAGLLE